MSKAVELFGDIAFLCQDHQLLLKTLWVEFDLHFLAARKDFLALQFQHLWH